MRPLLATTSTERAGPDAPSSGIAIRTVLEVGIGCHRTIQTTSDADQKQIHYRRHRLLHKVGRSKSTTGEHRGIDIEIFIRIYMVSVRLSDRTHKRTRIYFLGQVVVVHKRSMPYYPHANRLAESTNKTLQNILRKIVNENRTDWDTKLHSALWAYRTTYKTSIRTTPFRLAFGLDIVMPIDFQIPSLRIQVRERLSEKESERIWSETLCELEEHCIASLLQLELEQR